MAQRLVALGFDDLGGAAEKPWGEPRIVEP